MYCSARRFPSDNCGPLAGRLHPFIAWDIAAGGTYPVLQDGKSPTPGPGFSHKERLPCSLLNPHRAGGVGFGTF